MKPYPRSALKNFTRPLGIGYFLLPLARKAHAAYGLESLSTAVSASRHPVTSQTSVLRDLVEIGRTRRNCKGRTPPAVRRVARFFFTAYDRNKGLPRSVALAAPPVLLNSTPEE
jgi:hypothetical protein